MLIGISGKKQSGKNLTANIIKAIALLNNIKPFSNKEAQLKFIKNLSLLGVSRHENTSIYHLHSSPLKEISFADNVKKIASLITNIPVYDYNKESIKKSKFELLNITHRELLQKIGEGLRKSIDLDIWVKLALLEYTENKNIIITDVRYKNEADSIKKLNGILIRINRDKGDDNHQSEIDLDDYPDFDHIINNDSDIEDLILKILNINAINFM